MKTSRLNTLPKNNLPTMFSKIKIVLVVTIVLLMLPEIFSQQDSTKPKISKNAVYLSLLGEGGAFTLNYERLFVIKNQRFSIRIGGMTFDLSKFGSSYFDFENSYLIPLSINYLIPLKKKYAYLESGVGFTYENGFGPISTGLRHGTVIYWYTPYGVVERAYYTHSINLWIKTLGFRFQAKNRLFFRFNSVMWGIKLKEFNPDFPKWHSKNRMMLFEIAIGYSF